MIDGLLALLYILPVVAIFTLAAAVADFIEYLRRR